MRVVDLGNGVTVVLDIVAWAAVHFVAGYAAHRMPLSALSPDRGILRLLPFERDGRVYERLSIRRWKDRLPEAGAFFTGGMSKRRIPSRADGGLDRFVAETRRAELAHWWAVAALPVFALFNPWYAMPLLALYALVANVPCIAVQRYNRSRLARVLEFAARRRSSLGTIGANMP